MPRNSWIAWKHSYGLEICSWSLEIIVQKCRKDISSYAIVTLNAPKYVYHGIKPMATYFDTLKHIYNMQYHEY